MRRHFEKHRTRTPWAFCWIVSIEGLIVSVVAVALLNLVIDVPMREFLEEPPFLVLLIVLVLAPVVETLIFQVAPITLARFARRRFRTQILISTILFGAVHFPEGIAVGVGAGLIGGFYLAFTYAHWAQRSFWTALWTTTVSHTIRNTLAVLVLALCYVVSA